MATGGSIVLTKENKNYARASFLVVELGTEAVRELFDKIPLFDPKVLSKNIELNRKSREMKAIPQFLRNTLFPSEDESKVLKSSEFDLTLMVALLDKLYDPPPAEVLIWDATKNNIKVIKENRNKLAHSNASISDQSFNAIWRNTIHAIQCLVDASIIPRYHQKMLHLSQMSIDDEEFNKALARLEIGQLQDTQRQHGSKITGLQDTQNQHASQITGLQETQSHHGPQITRLKDTQRQHGSALGQHGYQITGLQDTQSKHGSTLKQHGSQMTRLQTDIEQLRVERDVYKGGKQNSSDIRDLQSQLCRYYSIHMAHVQRLPSDEDDTMDLLDIFVDVGVCRIVLTNTHKKRQSLDHYSQVFSIANKGSHILVEGGPGVGKTTLIKRIAIDWVDMVERKKENIVKELQNYDLLFVVSLGYVSSNESLASVIIDQHSLNTKEELLENILDLDERILLVFDGYDEYSVGTCPQIDTIVERKCFANLTVLMTSRPWKTIVFSNTKKFFEYHFQIDGFTITEIIDFVIKYFQSESVALHFFNCIEEDDFFELARVPIILLIFCLLYEEEDQSLPQEKCLLYWKLMEWFYNRYKGKKGQSDLDLEEVLMRLGKLALENISKKQGQLLFRKDQIEKQLGSDFFRMGFLSSQKVRGSRSDNIQVTFPHKSIQDYVAGYYLAKSPGGLAMIKHTIPISQEYIDRIHFIFEFAVNISQNILPYILKVCSPLGKNAVGAKCKAWIFDGNLDMDCLWSTMLNEKNVGLGIAQSVFSSFAMLDPITINQNNLDPSSPVKTLLPKSVPGGTLTVRDIVNESETVSAVVCFALTLEKQNLFQWYTGILTNARVILVGYYDAPGVITTRNREILQCLDGCDLKLISELKFPKCNYSWLEIRTICNQPANLKVLDLSLCKITKDLTGHLCGVITKQRNLFELNLSGNEHLDWGLLITTLLTSNLRSLRKLKMRSCNIPKSVVLPLTKLIKGQRDLVSLDVSNYFPEANVASTIDIIIPGMVNPTFNLVSLSIGPITPEQSKALKTIILCSPNLRELMLCFCKCDVSKEIIEKESLEILDISFNGAWGSRCKHYLDVANVFKHLEKLQNLTRIRATGCNIGNDIMDHLIKNLHKNPNLTWVEMLVNSISKDKIETLRGVYHEVDFLCDMDDYNYTVEKYTGYDV